MTATGVAVADGRPGAEVTAGGADGPDTAGVARLPTAGTPVGAELCTRGVTTALDAVLFGAALATGGSTALAAGTWLFFASGFGVAGADALPMGLVLCFAATGAADLAPGLLPGLATALDTVPGRFPTLLFAGGFLLLLNAALGARTTFFAVLLAGLVLLAGTGVLFLVDDALATGFFALPIGT